MNGADRSAARARGAPAGEAGHLDQRRGQVQPGHAAGVAASAASSAAHRRPQCARCAAPPREQVWRARPAEPAHEVVAGAQRAPRSCATIVASSPRLQASTTLRRARTAAARSTPTRATTGVNGRRLRRSRPGGSTCSGRADTSHAARHPRGGARARAAAHAASPSSASPAQRPGRPARARRLRAPRTGSKMQRRRQHAAGTITARRRPWRQPQLDQPARATSRAAAGRGSTASHAARRGPASGEAHR